MIGHATAIIATDEQHHQAIKVKIVITLDWIHFLLKQLHLPDFIKTWSESAPS
jgi:hypothetical protein